MHAKRTLMYYCMNGFLDNSYHNAGLHCSRTKMYKACCLADKQILNYENDVWLKPMTISHTKCIFIQPETRQSSWHCLCAACTGYHRRMAT